MVPHLITALTGPINELEQRILDSMPAIERWFRLEWMEHTPPFYTSVDIRNAGFKLAPVDTNLFPGGWNHLTNEMLPLAVQAAMARAAMYSSSVSGFFISALGFFSALSRCATQILPKSSRRAP